MAEDGDIPPDIEPGEDSPPEDAVAAEPEPAIAEGDEAAPAEGDSPLPAPGMDEEAAGAEGVVAEEAAGEVPAEEAPAEEAPAEQPSEEPLALQEDPTAEDLGPTDIVELQASGYQVADEPAPMEDGQLPPAPSDQLPAHQPFVEGEQPAGFDMGAGGQEYPAGEYPPADYPAGEYPPADGAQGGDAYGGNVYGAEDLGAYAQYSQDDPAAYGAGGYDGHAGGQDGAAAGPEGGYTAVGGPGAQSGHYQHHGAPPASAGADARALAEQLLAEEREKHETQMKVEAKAREELEDMILRIEKHFKAEQAARKKAEELLQASIAAEMESKAKIEDVFKKRSQEQRLLEEERGSIKRERMALESMRQDFEGELQAARSEVAKAQEALASSEERIRATEQVERARLEADYQARLAAMQQEMERMREELGYRTMVMGSEMEKWRQQAALTANAVLEAKNDVLERKKELDHTKEKMDKLLEKLYIGRERGIELSGAIASNQRMMSYMPGGLFMPPGAMRQGMQAMGAGAPMQAWASAPVKLPPLANKQQHPQHGMLPQQHQYMQQQQPMMYEGMGSMGMHEYADQPAPPAASIRRAHSATRLPEVAGQQTDGYGIHASHSEGQVNPDGQHGATGNAQYAHVQSKFARDAAEKGMEGKAKARAKSGRVGNIKAAKPDRFAEAERDASRVAGMGRRWN